MSAATQAIDTPERSGKVLSIPVAAATVLFAGTLAAITAGGNAVPAADDDTLRVIGRVEADVDNSGGAAGDLNVIVRRGVFRYANSVGDPLTAADIGEFALVEDDQTVSSTGGCKAGRILSVDSSGVWIDIHDATLTPGLEGRVPFTALAALTSTNGTAGAAADLTALKAEAEHIGDDVRAVYATLAGVINACQAHGILPYS